jgi:uncharacterized protein (DUF1810 family)
MPHAAPGALPDPFDLERFFKAQNPVYSSVLHELRNGLKTGHWIWFVFPQIRGLGLSSTSQQFSIGSKEEAIAYLNHSILGPRLRECTQLMLDIQEKPLRQILGSPDDVKFRSSMTLFARAKPEDDLFQRALDKYFDGEEDRLTVERL